MSILTFAQPLLAARDDSIWAAIVIVISIISWLIKLVSNQKGKVPPVANRPRPPVRPRDDRLQNEIDIFIQEVGQKKPARRPPAPPPPPRPAPVTAKGRPAKPAPPRRLQPQTIEPRDSSAGREIRPGREIASRHIATGEGLGAGVQQHLKQHMAERVATEASAFVGDKVDQSVARHLGQPLTGAGPAGAASSTMMGASTAPTRGTNIAELFRNPSGLRQAIIVNLVLSPPPGRKRRIVP